MTGSLKVIVLKLLVFAAFTLSATGLLAAVIGNIQPFTPFYRVDAEFADVTGLLDTDVVKVAGATIGKVAGIRLETGEGRAKGIATLQIHRDVILPRNVRADIRFRNLVGQRMVVLSRPPGPEEPPLSTGGGALIPLEQTTSAFDLGVVFNNLRPVLRTLNPDDVNVVSQALVRIFGGREETTRRLVADLADLSEVLGERAPQTGRLLTDLNTVVSNLAEHDRELQAIIGYFEQFIVTLDERTPELLGTLDGVGRASEELAGLIAASRPDLDRAIFHLASVLALLQGHRADLEATLEALPGLTYAINRAGTYGEWGNLNVVCLEHICEAPYSSPSSVRGGGVDDIIGSVLGAVR